MRVNVYAEEMTERVEIVSKRIGDKVFHGLRIYLELPVSVGESEVRGPFMHSPHDDDSSAVTFWGKQDLRPVLRKALAMLDRYYNEPTAAGCDRKSTAADGARTTAEGLEDDAPNWKQPRPLGDRPER